MRALVGMPIAEAPSMWARTPDEYLTRALALRDAYRGHPRIATAFAPQAAVSISDDLLRRVATLADELDAGILLALHESRSEVEESIACHGLRPLQRLHALGMLTPALTAVHMAAVDESDFVLSQRSGIGIVLCPEAALRRGHGPPPVAAWAAAGMRLGLGGGTQAAGAGLDMWSQLKLLALLAAIPPAPVMDALAVATLGGAAALGLDAEIGSLAAGKWADLCCIDVDGPLLRIVDGAAAADRLTYDGSRGAVTDVWVAGRQLLAECSFTRLDWSALAAQTGEL